MALPFPPSTPFPLQIASFVALPLRDPLRAAIGTDHPPVAHLEATGWAGLTAILRREPIDLLVVDPAADGQSNVDAVSILIESYPATPVLLYAVLNPKMAAAISTLSRRGASDVVLYGIEDSPARFRARLIRCAQQPQNDDAHNVRSSMSE